MKEFELTQSYGTIEEMINSEEIAVIKEELSKGEIEFYAIVSRIGNKYDIAGNKIVDCAQNPYLLCQAPVCEQQEAIFQSEIFAEPVDVEIEKIEEENEMKYPEIEALIDEIVAKEIEGVNLAHAEEIAKLKEEHAIELENAKAEAKAELIAKLNG